MIVLAFVVTGNIVVLVVVDAVVVAIVVVVVLVVVSLASMSIILTIRCDSGEVQLGVNQQSEETGILLFG
jgi:hypothetical protein